MKLDRNTLGDSPASIYLIDVLNDSTNSKDKNILKQISTFKKIFTELLKSHEAGHISTGVVNTFVSYKRQDLEIQTQDLLAKGYSALVVNLYKNVVVAELKKYQRRASTIKQIEKSASDRARGLLRNKHQKFNNASLKTYGKAGDEKFDLEVQFNQHGVAQVHLDKSLVKDSITSESLMEKSRKRLAKMQAKGVSPLKKTSRD